MNKGPVTPNRMRNAKRHVRQTLIDYRAARRAALEFSRSVPPTEKEAHRISPHGRMTKGLLRREDLICTALELRRDWKNAIRQVAAYEKRGVQLGAAWSERGLQRVQRANSSR